MGFIAASTARAYSSQFSYARAVDLVNCCRSREANVLLDVSSASGSDRELGFLHYPILQPQDAVANTVTL